MTHLECLQSAFDTIGVCYVKEDTQHIMDAICKNMRVERKVLTAQENLITLTIEAVNDRHQDVVFYFEEGRYTGCDAA